jgi:feruloyl esterase
MIVAIGTNDTLASPGSQLDYYQSLLDKMGRTQVDSFARLFVVPQAGHGLNGSSYTVDGDGKAIPATPIPSTWDRVSLLLNWVERGVAPGMTETVTAGERKFPLCSYPKYPKFEAAAFVCAE